LKALAPTCLVFPDRPICSNRSFMRRRQFQLPGRSCKRSFKLRPEKFYKTVAGREGRRRNRRRSLRSPPGLHRDQSLLPVGPIRPLSAGVHAKMHFFFDADAGTK
jgi:hypothetical protein